jgi:5-methylcytosine-specific restriction endonuclease McrA
MAKPAYNSKIYQANRLRVLKRDDYSCYYCGSPANTVDHLIPLVKGGSHEEHNLVACCTRCNSSKKDRGVSFYFKRKTVNSFMNSFTPDQTEQPESGFTLPDRG